MRTLTKIVFLSAVGLAVSACGGGGSDSGSGSETAVSRASTPSSLSQRDIQTKAAQDAFDKRLAEALADSNEWLNANQRADGVTVTRSGLQYRINKASPNPTGKNYERNQAVTVHYEGSLKDGTIFDSSFLRGRPETLTPSELIQGWQEALSLMQPGDEWTLFIPPALGYGELGKTGSIAPNEVLIFKVQLR